MKVSVRVPATTANIGPGFDCFGMALSLYNTVTVEETVYPPDGLEINILDKDGDVISNSLIPTDKTNVVYKAIELLYSYTGQTPSALKINIKTGIPVAKGLGSSASVIVGGIIAANKLLGEPADKEAILSIANEVEGHPDNITPAILGGFMISSVEDNGSIVYRNIEWPDDWNLILCVPDYELSTQISRSVLPEAVPIADAAFNSRRCAMFIQALHSKDSELMKLALRDKLHQSYRKKLVPGFDEIMDNLKETDIIGTVLSGAGPSLLVISENNNFEEIKSRIKSVWEPLGVSATIKLADVDTQGAVIK